MTAPTISDLSDVEVVDLLRVVARKWIEQPSAEAFIINQRVELYLRDQDLEVPQWSFLESDKAGSELVQASKAALQCILDGENDVAKEWINEELNRKGEIRAQALEPVSLAILAATLIGCILAARVKKIGNLTFYEGLPKELGTVLKEAGGAIAGKI